MKFTRLCLVLGLVVAQAMGPGALADVRVSFVDPEHFSDIRDNDGFKRTEVLREIEQHFISQLGKRLGERDLRIEVTDVDLAGEVRPVWRNGQWLRVIRPIFSPAISLRYQVMEGGQLLRSGEAKLRDMSFMDTYNSYSSGDPLRYERRMIDRWLDSEFPPAVALKTER